ncbi:hypothetical protein Taro_049243 [Colocasia esculenta]|uniref:Peroxidase n=1 Tax=Colocasia esculenta TaxID=4460 RepID=A0A843XAC8_COLES|nr:hypothetical protein [Colocasia esculenta]
MAAPLRLGRAIPVLSFFLLLLICTVHAQLSANFYANSCPNLQTIVRSAMSRAVSSDQRMAASILRLFFHDCFVNGCDASVLLADTATFTGEQNAGPNQNSIRGLGVIDTIKANVEAACNGTVSCADILALATRDGVNLAGGPSWTVLLGRRDARTASQSAANSNLPSPASSLATLTSSFSAKGLSQRDLVALSGAHTIGFARSGGGNGLSPIDVQTPRIFDNAYYQNLVAQRGRFSSDQALFSNTTAIPTNPIVQSYIRNSALFFSDFVAAMVRMGSISPLTGTRGEIRRVCSRVN